MHSLNKKLSAIFARTPLRPAAIPGFLALALCGFVYFSLFFDAQLKTFLEQQATFYNGARVEIASARLHLWKGLLDLEDVQITNPSRPLENLFRLDHVRLSFLPSLLLRKKFLAQNMIVEGIRYAEPRTSSGALPEFEGLAILDRALPGLIPHLREEEANPLRHLGKLTSSFDLEAGASRLTGELQSLKKVSELNVSLDKVIALTESADTREPAARDATDKVDWQQELTLLRDEANALDGLVDEDVEMLRRKLGVPQLETQDLTRALFGPRLLSLLERIAYWADLSRRRMPAGSQRGEISWSRHATSGGTAVHFGKSGGFPALLLQNVTFLSDPSPGTGRGKVRGSIAELTTDPTICGYPTSFNLDADFPQSGVEGLHFSALINHLHEPLNESFKLSVDSFRVHDTSILETGELALSLQRAHGRLSIAGKSFTEGMQVDGHVALDGVELVVSSNPKQLSDALQPLLDPISSLDLRARAEGPMAKVELSAESQFGKDLARSLWQRFRYDQAAVDENLRRQVTDRLDAAREKLLARIAQIDRRLAATPNAPDAATTARGGARARPKNARKP